MVISKDHHPLGAEVSRVQDVPTSLDSVKVFKGNLIHATALGVLEVHAPGYIGVKESDGTILFMGSVEELHNMIQNNRNKYTIVDVGHRLILPGFIDGHTHAPQYSFVGLGMHLPLLEWLETYTFPCEAQFTDVKWAKKVYEASIKRHLAHGTTTCSYFGTIHLEASKVLAYAAYTLGQRALVGKVNMDRNAPLNLCESTSASLADTQAFIDYVHNLATPLLTPVITPRFVPSTSSELMLGLAQLSRKYEPYLPIQSHLSENRKEVEWVQSLHPEATSYASVYAQHGLLHERSYMAHCIWCSSSERELLRALKTGIIHCPNSNFSLSSGVCNVRRYLRDGVKVGLGTDVAGGYAVSMLDAIRQCIQASKMVSMGYGSTASSSDESKERSTVNSDFDTQYEALTYAEAFYLATMGSAECLGLHDTVGNFLVGKQFDALVVDPLVNGIGPLDHSNVDADTILDLFQRFLFLGDDRNIEQVFVRGVQVKKPAPSSLLTLSHVETFAMGPSSLD